MDGRTIVGCDESHQSCLFSKIEHRVSSIKNREYSIENHVKIGENVAKNQSKAHISEDKIQKKRIFLYTESFSLASYIVVMLA